MTSCPKLMNGLAFNLCLLSSCRFHWVLHSMVVKCIFSCNFIGSPSTITCYDTHFTLQDLKSRKLRDLTARVL